ncbi:MAG: hypothetical protein HZB20_02805 [Chloroflexi bacterium]|nr:hypothetical protein [Chloroflexota bacterium]
MKALTLRVLTLLAFLAFGITLAIVIGQRMSSEAMAVLMGVVAGVAASIPTSLLVVWIASRSLEKSLEAVAHPVTAPQPEPARVIVVQPAATPGPQPALVAGGAPGGWYPAAAYPAQAPMVPRKFTVIGGAGALEETLSMQPLEAE